MSWLERSRAQSAPGAGSDGATSQPVLPEPAAAEGGTSSEQPDLLLHLPKITQGRAGRYSVTDDEGHQIGIIYGDYVVGFTVSCWSLSNRYPDMDQVVTAIAREAQARAAAGLAAAS